MYSPYTPVSQRCPMSGFVLCCLFVCFLGGLRFLFPFLPFDRPCAVAAPHVPLLYI